MHVESLGDAAILVRLSDAIGVDAHERVRAALLALEAQPFPGMIEVVPAYTTLAVYYDPHSIDYAQARAAVETRLQHATPGTHASPRVVTIPVCYGDECGPDIDVVAGRAGVSVDAVVELHASATYRVAMIGFMPGFPYLLGLPEILATPRRETPRTVVPVGSVGIAGEQTGIYPLETPGGWQLIGRTPRRLFRAELDPPTLLRAGDEVRFTPISRDDFLNYREPAAWE
jgi:inhibitor of KinA